MPALFPRSAARQKILHSFTLIELLIVIGIIAILAALTLAAGSGVMQKASRSRAASEIAAMSTALESYKVDNGIYPPSIGLLGPPTGKYSILPTDITYKTSSQTLYRALSGQTNFLDTPTTSKKYMSFKANQLGNPKAAAGTDSISSSFIADPWGYSYGYSTGDGKTPTMTQYPFNGSGFFDLWSTGGVLKDTGTTYATNSWVNNWSGS